MKFKIRRGGGSGSEGYRGNVSPEYLWVRCKGHVCLQAVPHDRRSRHEGSLTRYNTRIWGIKFCAGATGDHGGLGFGRDQMDGDRYEPIYDLVHHAHTGPSTPLLQGGPTMCLDHSRHTNRPSPVALDKAGCFVLDRVEGFGLTGMACVGIPYARSILNNWANKCCVCL